MIYNYLQELKFPKNLYLFYKTHYSNNFISSYTWDMFILLYEENPENIMDEIIKRLLNDRRIHNKHVEMFKEFFYMNKSYDEIASGRYLTKYHVADIMNHVTMLSMFHVLDIIENIPMVNNSDIDTFDRIMSTVPKRIYNILRKNGINTVKDLEKKSFSDLYHIRGIGLKGFEYILSAIHEHNIKLRKQKVDDKYYIKISNSNIKLRDLVIKYFGSLDEI